MQICKPERTVYGDTEKSEKATLAKAENAIADFNNVTADDIKYYAKNGSKWNLLDKAPADAGTYKAEISVNAGTEDSLGAVTTAYAEYTIAKAEPVHADLNAVYGQTLEDIIDQLESGWSWADPKDYVGNVGPNSHKANYSGDANHESADNVDLTVNVRRSASSMTA